MKKIFLAFSIAIMLYPKSLQAQEKSGFYILSADITIFRNSERINVITVARDSAYEIPNSGCRLGVHRFRILLSCQLKDPKVDYVEATVPEGGTVSLNVDKDDYAISVDKIRKERNVNFKGK